VCVIIIGKGLQGKHGKMAYLERWMSSISSLTKATDTEFSVTFDWDHEKMGVPGAFIIRNNHHSQFYLKRVTIYDIPGHGSITFVCNSWVYPAHRYTKDRVFFSNKVINSFLSNGIKL
jgi:linoleate 9S-lipoxygenase